MKLKIFLMMMVNFVVIDSVGSDGLSPMENKYIRLEVLSGVEAEIIKIAVERFHSEELKINPHQYDISIYLDNTVYVVFFEKAKNALPSINFPAYEVVISSKTLKVTHTQF